MSAQSQEAVAGDRPFRRKVFYVAGYHLIPFRYYLKQIKLGIPVHEQVEGRSITLTEVDGAECADLSASGPSGVTETSYTFLGATKDSLHRLRRPGWHKLFDLPRNVLKTPAILRLFALMWRLQWIFYFCVAFAFGVTLTYIAALIGLGGWLGWQGASMISSATPLLWGGAALGVAVGAVLSALLLDINNRKFHQRLVVDCIQLLHDWVNGKAPELEGLIDDFTDQIEQEVATGQWDEILIVGHSIGGIMAVQVADRLIQRGTLPEDTPLALLTLGAVHILPCGLKADSLHHRALDRVSHSDKLDWHEVYSPRDPFNTPYKSPVEHYCAKPAAPLPRMHSLKITKRVSKAEYKSLKWSPWAMHFAYLQEVDRLVDFSLLRCMTAPAPLAQNMRLPDTAAYVGKDTQEIAA